MLPCLPDTVVVDAVFLQGQLLGELDVTDIALVVQISLLHGGW